MAYLDTLVPPKYDPGSLLGRLRALNLRDADLRVDPGPLDEATLNLVVAAFAADEHRLWLELPRGNHDMAVILGVYLQLMRLGERMRGRYEGMGFDGPIIVAGLNTNLTDRLRRIRIGGKSLSEAMCAQRIRADGQVTDLRRSLSSADAWPQGLMYLNTSLGWPRLPGVRVGAVIIDRTSFRNPATLDMALAWADAQGAERILVLADLADTQPPTSRDSGWIRWPWVPSLRSDLAYEVGVAAPAGPLSTNALLAFPPKPIGTAVYRAPAIAHARNRCLSAIAAARRIPAEFPNSVANAVQLVNHLGRIWGQIRTANEWAVMDPRGVSTATLVRKVSAARGEDMRGTWAGYAETHWSDLRRNALELAELLSAYNPRLDMLLGILDWIEVNRLGYRITVRAHTRSGAMALRQDLRVASPSLASRLSGADLRASDLFLMPYGERLPWTDRDALEIHLGLPPPWRRNSLFSSEAVEHVLVLDEDELTALPNLCTSLDREWNENLRDADQTLRLGGVPQLAGTSYRSVYGPVALDSRGQTEAEAYPKPTIDLSQLFATFSSAVSAVEQTASDESNSEIGRAGRRTISARPITLDPDGAVYWLPMESRAEVLVGARCTSVVAADITSGMRFLMPRGETRDGLYVRLLKAVYQDADVMAVGMLLSRFRKAVRKLHDREGSWDAVVQALRMRGSTVTSGQACRLWATGDVIAPVDVQDIRRVGLLTRDEALTGEGAWERLGAVAAGLRRLHRELGRLVSAAIGEAASGEHGAALARLSDLCGGLDPAEILEEFEIRQVRHVGPPEAIDTSRTRRLLPRSIEVDHFVC